MNQRVSGESRVIHNQQSFFVNWSSRNWVKDIVKMHLFTAKDVRRLFLILKRRTRAMKCWWRLWYVPGNQDVVSLVPQHLRYSTGEQEGRNKNNRGGASRLSMSGCRRTCSTGHPWFVKERHFICRRLVCCWETFWMSLSIPGWDRVGVNRHIASRDRFIHYQSWEGHRPSFHYSPVTGDRSISSDS